MSPAAPSAPRSDSPHTHLDAADLLYDRMVRLQAYAATNWRPLIGGAALLLVSAAIGIGFRAHRTNRSEAAAAALHAAGVVDDDSARLAALTGVAADFAGTGGGLQAAFAGAQLAFAAEDFATARALYERVLHTQPDSPLAPAAALGLGAVLEAEHRPDEAGTAYLRSLERYPDAYSRPQAQLALARLAEARGDTPQALTRYREVVSSQPGTAWEREASGRIAALAPAASAPVAADAAPGSPATP